MTSPALPSPAPERPVVPPDPQAGHLSTLTLHQLRYGELDDDQAHAAHAHLEACEACRTRHQSQLAFRRAFEVKAPPLALPVAGPSPWERLLSWLRWAPVPVLVAALALVAVRLAPDDADPDATRLKGGEEVVVLVEDHGVLDAGEAIRPGDRLQLRIPAGLGAEAWVGDADGLIGRFPLDPDQPTLSPFALTVDGQAGDEELIVVLSREPLDRQAAQAAASGRRMSGVEVRRIALQKER